MREISVGDRYEYQFSSVCSALLIGDVDDNGEDEVVAASRDGYLAVFTVDEPRPVRYATDCGCVVVLAVGDLFNSAAVGLAQPPAPVAKQGAAPMVASARTSMPSGSASSLRQQPLPRVVQLCAIAADGALSVFHVPPITQATGVARGGTLTATSSLPQQQDAYMSPVFAQPLPSNIGAAFICDIDADGQNELVVALTDRVVRTYRFKPNPAATPADTMPAGRLIALSKFELPLQINCVALHAAVGQMPPPQILVSQQGSRYVLIEPRVATSPTLTSEAQVLPQPASASSLNQQGIDTSIKYYSMPTSTKAHLMTFADVNDEVQPDLFYIWQDSAGICEFFGVSDFVSILAPVSDAPPVEQYLVRFPTPVFRTNRVGRLRGVEGGRLLASADWQGNIYVVRLPERLSTESSLAVVDAELSSDDEGAESISEPVAAPLMVHFDVREPLTLFTAKEVNTVRQGGSSKLLFLCASQRSLMAYTIDRATLTEYFSAPALLS